VSNLVRAEKLPQAAAAKAPTKKGELQRIIQLLRHFAKGNRRPFVLGFIMLLAEMLTALADGLPLAFVLDYLSNPANNPDFPTFLKNQTGLVLPPIASPLVITVGVLALAVVVIAMLNSLTDSLAEIYLAKGGRLLGYNMRVQLYSHLQKLSLAFYNQQRTGDLLTRVTGDVSAIEEFMTKSLSDIIGGMLTLIGTVLVVFYLSWQVGLVMLVLVPLLAFISDYFSQRVKAASKKARSREGELAASAQEMLTSIRVIQTYGSGGNQLEKFSKQSERTMDSSLEAAGIQARFSFTFKVLESAILAAIICLGVFLNAQNLIALGTLVFLVKKVDDMFKPTKKIIKEWNTVGKIYASVERIGEILDRTPAVTDTPNAIQAPRFAGNVAFNHVSFAYMPDAEDVKTDETPQLRLALSDVNFTIAPGEVVALVGGSGAGKSTIVQLLPRLYDPHTGSITIDGTDIRSFTLDSLRSQMSMVLQEAVLFTGTVAANIAYGRENATREEIIAAAMQASAHEFIEQLPDGYETVLGERAGNLSGGQRQRIAIARAFIRNTPILILDEPTTGLDAESTELVLQALRQLMKGKATIIISHDLNLIRNADKIIAIAQGRIEQIGSHKGLLRAGGLYAELYHKQFGQAVEEQGRSILPIAAPPAADDEDEVPSISPKLFQTMMIEALPAPASIKAFQTMSMPAVAPRADSTPAAATPAAPAVTPAAARTDPPVAAATSAPVAKPAVPPEPGRAKAKEVGTSFATMLLRVIPEAPSNGGPATSAPDAPAGLSDEQLDPLRSPSLQQELPGLATALDAAKMRGYLQTVLFGKGRADWTIESCEVDQAAYPIGECAIFRYLLTLRKDANGPISTHRVNGRMFPSQLDCALYVRDRLAPIAALMRGRPEVAPFVAAVGVVEPLNLAVHVFPIDGDLPTLINATDNARMAEVLGEVLNTEQSQPFAIDQCQVELVDYARRDRCTLRYNIDGRRPGTSAPERQTVYGKVFANQSGALAGRVVDALRAWVAKGSAFQFDVPRVLAWRADLHLSLLETIPGNALIADQLKARLRGKPTSASQLSLDEMIDACAKVAAALHSSPIKLGPRRAFDDEIAALRRELEPIQRFSPVLGERLLDTIQQFETYAEQSDPLPLCFCHGDFTHGQLLFAGRDTGLIDFDSVCQAEPALDLGQFLIYLKLAGRKGDQEIAQPLIEQLSERFLSTYIAAMGHQIEDPERLRIRVAVYQALGSLRRTLRSWQKIKGERLQGAIVQLEEELACLPPLDY
jgi:ABC-type multidrug transport system fused ATPase/permease subunit